ncbi:uncharacterized protein EI90DRAFT_3062502 [Cantharellus anzutake]|uniref:uncharacterized protein n=1 Tax=Cantharellus anzutake TaxID=1750568 RepID=UPI0019088DC6|nr:uncharacterized protein EI90DRAFT_3062502 [Cantharellus anzutake]KAF8329404.1 hypothetical protein EI90DRAFT_3062502 [Cantharellus anzutake]
MYDPYSSARLATVTAPHSSSKKKIITLHDPDVPVEFNFIGTMSFKWSFQFEDHEFEWKKDSCYVIRKPDPPVIVCTTRSEAKDKPASVQILDYNVKRFDINDRKGLEVLLLCGLLTFTDYVEGTKEIARQGNVVPTVTPTRPVVVSLAQANKPPPAAGDLPSKPPPSLPPKPVYNFTPYEKNEVLVTEDAKIEEYAQHCLTLLADPALLYVIIKSHTADQVSKVVQVAQETKRLHHREVGDEEELHQYVKYGEAEDTKGKKPHRVINLDDAPAAKKVEYKPPTSLTIHLSKIELPDLIPNKRQPPTSPQSLNPVDTRFGLPSRARAATPEPPKSETLKQPNDRRRRNSFGPSPKPSKPQSPTSSQPQRLTKTNGNGRYTAGNPQPPRPTSNGPSPVSSRPRPTPGIDAPSLVIPEPRTNNTPSTPSASPRPSMPLGYHDPNHHMGLPLMPGGYPEAYPESAPAKSSKASVMERLFGR